MYVERYRIDEHTGPLYNERQYIKVRHTVPLYNEWRYIKLRKRNYPRLKEMN